MAQKETLQALLDKIEQARAHQDARSYAELISKINEYGVFPEENLDQLLLEQGEADILFDQVEAERLLEKWEKQEYDTQEPPKLWGIRKKDLSQLSYDSLENIFYGIPNLTIPTEMLDVLNPEEILAEYYGAGTLKRDNLHRPNGTLLDQFQEFYSLVRKMDSLAYHYKEKSFLTMVVGSKKRFSSKPNEQKRRLGSLDEGIRHAFVQSFSEPYVPSKREQPSLPDAFYDPNIDGRNKQLYVDEIYRKIRLLWEARSNTA